MLASRNFLQNEKYCSLSKLSHFKILNIQLITIQQTTKGHNSILDSILPLPPNHHQKDQEIPRIPRHQSHKLIRDYLTGPTHQNEDHTYSSPHCQRNDCTATYNGQTNRSLIKRIKEHESHSKLHLHNPDDFSKNQSAPAHHSRTTRLESYLEISRDICFIS